MSKVFDRKRCLSNINLLIAQKKIKVGSLEEAIGVSRGYISRLSSEANNTKLSIDFLVTIADELDITLDDLLNTDLGEMTANELYLFQFLEVVLKQTIDDTREWVKESTKAINAIKGYSDGSTDHPLFKVVNNKIVYNSLFFESPNIMTLNGDIFHTNISNNVNLYAASVKDAIGGPNGIELYFVNTQYDILAQNFVSQTKPLFFADKNDDGELSSFVFKFYNSIVETSKKFSIPAAVRSTIDAFMEENASGELPF